MAVVVLQLVNLAMFILLRHPTAVRRRLSKDRPGKKFSNYKKRLKAFRDLPYPARRQLKQLWRV
jgi:hypothetical protein